MIAGIDGFEARLRELEDERAILRTLYRYAHAQYDGDREKFLDCFTDDAEVVRQRHGRVVRGREALGEFFDAITHLPDECHKHIIVEPLIDITGDAATVSSDFLYVQDRDGPMISHFGHYSDRLRRCDDGVWRLTRREMRTEAVGRGDVSTIEGSPGAAMEKSE